MENRNWVDWKVFAVDNVIAEERMTFRAGSASSSMHEIPGGEKKKNGEFKGVDSYVRITTLFLV